MMLTCFEDIECAMAMSLLSLTATRSLLNPAAILNLLNLIANLNLP